MIQNPTLILSLIIILVAFLLGIFARRKGTQDEFWRNEGKTRTASLVATIVATQVGAGTILGIASSTFFKGTGFGLVALASTVFGFILMGLLAFRIRTITQNAADIYTLPDFIGLKFGKLSERVSALTILFAYLGLLGGQILALASFLQVLGVGGNIYTVLIAGIGAVCYCAVSGLRGDIAADRWFFGVMCVSLVLTLYALLGLSPQFSIAAVKPEILSPITFGGYTYVVAGILFGAALSLVSMELWMRIFASEDPGVARKAYLLSAVVVVPFYLVPLAVGLMASALKLVPTNNDAIFLEFMRSYSPEIISTVVGASLVAVVLSTANTYVLVISGVFTRNLFNVKDSLGIQQVLIAIIGVVATTWAFVGNGLVDILLNAFFVILALLPAVLAAMFDWRIHPTWLSLGMVLGAFAVYAFYSALGPQAFLPAVGISAIFTLGGYLHMRYGKHA